MGELREKEGIAVHVRLSLTANTHDDKLSDDFQTDAAEQARRHRPRLCLNQINEHAAELLARLRWRSRMSDFQRYVVLASLCLEMMRSCLYELG